MIKAIPTKYRGYEFRSKLEAHWVIDFDEYGVQWEYEPEGFKLGDGVWYLPDFKLKDVLYEGKYGLVEGDLYVEVKGVMDEESKKKITQFVFGDKDTVAKNNISSLLNSLEETQYRPKSEIIVRPQIENPLLVVGAMPPDDAFYSYSRPYNDDIGITLNHWIFDHFGEPIEDRLFYAQHTLNGSSDFVFPFKRKGGGMCVVDPVNPIDADIEGTKEALYRARNYRFDHKK